MYANPQAVVEQTNNLAVEGVRLLNFWRLAATEDEHVAALLALLTLPSGARVVDLGSGTGAFAQLALQHRPDLQFTLVNDNAWQLEQSPSGAHIVLADMAQTGLPTAHYDAVILAYALGHGDVVEVLEEAHRLLAPGGALLLHDLHARDIAGADWLKRELDYAAHSHTLLCYWASLIGFDAESFTEDTYLAPGEIVGTVAATGLLNAVAHGVTVLRKSERPHKFRNRKAGLQFSGGKDSLACLYILRPFLKQITVYRLNTGDTLPETDEVVAAVRAWIPNFVEIKADVRSWRAEHGMPSDLVPAHAHEIGMRYGMNDHKISNRFDCCWNNLMQPMHQRALADGIDLIIRGTKLADTGTLPHEGWQDGAELWLPVRDFTHDDVFAFLREVGAPVSPIYEFATGISAPECLGCTAWWDDHKGAYLKARHPKAHTAYIANLRIIERSLLDHLGDLMTEIETEN